jgi:hypothetical protein
MARTGMDTTTRPTTGQPQILASYQWDEGTRQLVGQRIKGTVALSDIPAGDDGKVYLIERQLLSRVEHERGKVALGEPLPEARRQQQLLITIARQKVLGHYSPRLADHPIVPTGGDPRSRFMRHPRLDAVVSC